MTDMTAALGINVAYGADPAAIAVTGARFVRVVYRDNLPLRPWITDLKNRGVECLFVFDSSPESLSDNEGQWAGRLTVARSNYGDLVKLMQPGNEPDWTGMASWTMTQNRVNRLLGVARGVFPREQGFTLVAPGMVSGQASWMQGVRIDLCDAIDAHPYAKWVDTEQARADLNWMLDRYIDLGKPVWCAEYDSRTLGMSAYLRDYPGIERAAVMAWDNAQTDSEGLAMGLLQNPAAMADFVAATGGPGNQPPPEHHAEYVLGFQKWFNLEPSLLGAAQKNERNVAPQWQIQPTEKGVLSWVGNKGHAFVTHDGRVFRWNEDAPASWEVPE